MKILTFFIACVHLIYIIGVMWLGPLIIFYNSKTNNVCEHKKWYMGYLVIVLLQIMHWFLNISKNECVLSYLEKKSEDKNYVKGQDPEKTYAWIILNNVTGIPINTIREYHGILSKVSFLTALFVISFQCDKTKSRMLMTYIFMFFALKYVQLDSFKMTTK